MTETIKIRHLGLLAEIEVDSAAKFYELDARAQHDLVLKALEPADVPVAKGRMTFAVELLKFATTAKVPPARAVNDFVSTANGAELYLTTHVTSEVSKGRCVEASKRAVDLTEQLDAASADYARQQQAYGNQLTYDAAIAAVKQTTKGAHLAEQIAAAYEGTQPGRMFKNEHQAAIEKEYLDAEAEFLKANPRREFISTPFAKQLRDAIDDEMECSMIEQQAGPVAGLEMRKMRALARKPREVPATKAKGAELEFETAAKAHAFDKGCSLTDAYADLMETSQGLEMYRRAEKSKHARTSS